MDVTDRVEVLFPRGRQFQTVLRDHEYVSRAYR